MSTPPSPRSRSNVIAFVWDFDGTLARGYMQEPLFRRYGINEELFWKEVHAITAARKAQRHDVRKETVYLERLLAYVHRAPGAGQQPPLAGLSNAILWEMGAEVTLFPGAVELLRSLKELPLTDPACAGFTVEHYVVSTGFKATIEGTAIAPYVDRTFACEFGEGMYLPGLDGTPGELVDTGVIQDVVFDMTHAGKTQALFEIHKGVHKNDGWSVDDTVPHHLRHVPFEQMVYVADGPSDIPAFSVTTSGGGTAVAVYDPEHSPKFEAAMALHEQGRVQHILAADYQPGSPAWQLFHGHAVRLARRITQARDLQIAQETSAAIGHIGRDEGGAPAWYRPSPARQKVNRALEELSADAEPTRAQPEPPHRGF